MQDGDFHQGYDIDKARAAHDWLDARGLLSILQNRFDYSLREIDALSQRYSGLRASPASLSKFVNRASDAPRTLPGVSHVAIRVMASTSTSIARRSLTRELSLRTVVANYHRTRSETDKTKLVTELALAQSDVAVERRLIQTLLPAEQGCTERALDLAAVDYLDGQISIHLGRLSSDEEKARMRHYESGLRSMSAVSERLDHALRAGARAAETIDLILAVNSRLNSYFTAYEMDVARNDGTFNRTRVVADKIASPLFLLAANDCAEFQNDPRVAFNAASAAGFAKQHSAAAKSLMVASKIDGFDGSDIRDWHAAWMLEPLTASEELADAVRLLVQRQN